MPSFVLVVCAAFIYVGVINKRVAEGGQLPLKVNCNVLTTVLGLTQQYFEEDRCYKGDLIDMSIAHCEPKSSKTKRSISKCSPINHDVRSTTVDVPDGMNCVPVSDTPVRCGEKDTRCVCDAPLDTTGMQTNEAPRPYFLNSCRCQYWPSTDIRDSRPAVCRQYDHGGAPGGVIGTHFYACCNNCNDRDTSCDGETYQGGGSTRDNLCGACGNRMPYEQHSLHRYTFNCGSCSQQRQCRDHCNKKHPFEKEAPGLCFQWVGCFRDCCLGIKPSHFRERFEL